MHPKSDPPKKENKSGGEGVLLVAVIAVVAIAWIFLSIIFKDDEKKTAAPPKPKATYTGTLGRYKVLDPQTILANVTVKNVSDISGTPSCFVQVASASGAYKGYKTFDTGKTLAPGEEFTFGAQLTITGEGAAYVTEGRADCKES